MAPQPVRVFEPRRFTKTQKYVSPCQGTSIREPGCPKERESVVGVFDARDAHTEKPVSRKGRLCAALSSSNLDVRGSLPQFVARHLYLVAPRVRFQLSSA